MFSEATCREPEWHTSELFGRGNDIEKGKDARDLSLSEFKNIYTLNGCPAKGWCEAWGVQYAGVSCSDSPESGTTPSIGGHTNGVFDDISEVRECGEDGLTESPNSLSASGRWLQHSHVKPLDIVGKHREEKIQIARIPGI